MALLGLLAGCAKINGAGIDASRRPTLRVVAAGDTAKLYVSWSAATKATGALLTLTVTATNGTWAALPVSQAVTAGGTATVLTNSATADSGTFQACLKSTNGTIISVGQTCSNTRQWKRTLQPPPSVTIDSLVGLLVAPGVLNVVVGQTSQLCAYYQFASTHVAMRTQDSLGCAGDYATRFTVFQKAVTNTEQLWADSRCQRWTSSVPSVATVTTEAGCTGLGWLWMGVPVDVLRAT